MLYSVVNMFVCVVFVFLYLNLNVVDMNNVVIINNVNI